MVSLKRKWKWCLITQARQEDFSAEVFELRCLVVVVWLAIHGRARPENLCKKNNEDAGGKTWCERSASLLSLSFVCVPYWCCWFLVDFVVDFVAFRLWFQCWPSFLILWSQGSFFCSFIQLQLTCVVLFSWNALALCFLCSSSSLLELLWWYVEERIVWYSNFHQQLQRYN